MRFEVRLTLKSDATFGCGQGVAGLVDAEVEHDEYGLPFVRGRTLKGLLVRECADILFALARQGAPAFRRLEGVAAFLYGRPGSGSGDAGALRVGAARLPRELREAVAADVEAGRLRPADVLDSLTALRVQTAVDEDTGAPEKGSLRVLRVLLRETPLAADLAFEREPGDDALALLAACVRSLRRGGTGRNRGRGRLEARLHAPDGRELTEERLCRFRALVRGEAS